MKKIFAFTAVFCFAAAVFAQENSNLNLLFSDEMLAKDSAGKILDNKPKSFETNIKSSAKKKSSAKLLNEEAKDPAPFGLLWGASKKQITASGVTLEPIDKKDGGREIVGVFFAHHLQKPLADFQQVEVTFGKENSLWRIVGYGTYIDDDAKASKALFLYKKYFSLLENKYGKGTEVFTPKISKKEKIINAALNKKEIEEVKEPMGGEGFRDFIKNGEASLYAKFEKDGVGVALSVNANDKDQSFIIIDYKNLKLMEKKDNKTLEAL